MCDSGCNNTAQLPLQTASHWGRYKLRENLEKLEENYKEVRRSLLVIYSTDNFICLL